MEATVRSRDLSFVSLQPMTSFKPMLSIRGGVKHSEKIDRLIGKSIEYNIWKVLYH